MKCRLSFSLFLVLSGWSVLRPEGLAQGTPADRKTPAGRAAALMLPDALARVFERNPDIAVSELEIEAASARVLQAGMKPNPEIALQGENLATPGIGPGVFRYTESTLEINQRMELGGKRVLRVRAAQKEASVAASQLEVKKNELIAETSQAFADVLAEQERLANLKELTKLAQQSYAIVVERVAAGKVSPVEETRASVELASARLEEEKHARVLVAVQDGLAALWGGTHQDIDTVQGSFDIPPVVSELPEGCLQNNPDMKLAAAAVDSRNATLGLELANRTPDITLSAGFRRLDLDKQDVWVAGVSIPLPLFDKRQGAIAEARTRLDQSRSEQQAAARRLRASWTQATHAHEIALLEAKTLAENALPAAREAAAAIEEGYRLGKFDLVNVLDSQRTNAEFRGKYIEAVASGMKAAIEIERLTRCDSLPALPKPGK
jgi:cobalt-zinc-cadmium efflux system outer membrane protein